MKIKAHVLIVGAVLAKLFAAGEVVDFGGCMLSELITGKFA